MIMVSWVSLTSEKTQRIKNNINFLFKSPQSTSIVMLRDKLMDAWKEWEKILLGFVFATSTNGNKFNSSPTLYLKCSDEEGIQLSSVEEMAKLCELLLPIV